MKVNFEKDFKESKFLNFYSANYKVGLDIDECLADFIGKYRETYGHCDINSWYFSYNTMKNLDVLKNNKEWWTSLKPLIKPTDLPFMPHCYISKRSFDVRWTEEWIEKVGLPCVPVIHVEDSKIEACKDMDLDFFVDDSMLNFQRLNGAGIKTFLYDSIHNQQYNVGGFRIKSYGEIFDKI